MLPTDSRKGTIAGKIIGIYYGIAGLTEQLNLAFDMQLELVLDFGDAELGEMDLVMEYNSNRI